MTMLSIALGASMAALCFFRMSTASARPPGATSTIGNGGGPSDPAESSRSQADESGVLATDLSVRMTRDAVESLRANMDRFRFDLSYHGQDAGTYRSLHLGVQPATQTNDSFVQISRDQAELIVGWLARDGMLYRGSINRMKLLVQPREPYYDLRIQGAENGSYFEFLPWGSQPYPWHNMIRPPLAEWVGDLRGVLSGKAGEAIYALAKPLETTRQTEDEPK
jgi:hypothetical protein